jgi:hypothetical protein
MNHFVIVKNNLVEDEWQVNVHVEQEVPPMTCKGLPVAPLEVGLFAMDMHPVKPQKWQINFKLHKNKELPKVVGNCLG